MASVLVVEKRRRPVVAHLLEGADLAVVTALVAQEAVSALGSLRPDLVLVEADQPTAEVLDLCVILRASTRGPIALLTGPCGEREAVAALTSGIDTLILEPVGQHELISRVRALLRRAPAVPSERSRCIVVGPIELDVDRRELRVFGEKIDVPRREFDIAQMLMENAGRVVSRQALIRAYWGSARGTKSLDVQVGRLRSRLVAAEGRRRILTVRGIGYRFLKDGDPEVGPLDSELLLGGDEVEIDLLAPQLAGPLDSGQSAVRSRGHARA
jgi:DNA-binding response OmpR family regulator